MHFILKILITFATFTTFATANPFLPDCVDDNDRNSCTMNWVNNNQHFELNWAPLAAEHSPNLTTDENGTLQANSASPPTHVDIDHDGYKDLVFFTLLGMVNGDFTIHRFNPDANTYAPLGTVNGSHFNIDKSGYLVSIGRSSCCESGANFHTLANDEITLAFQMDIRPAELSTDTEQCSINPVDGGPTLETIKRDNAQMIADYCDYYQDTGVAKIKSRSWQRNTAYKNFHTIAPNAVFYCQIVGTDKHVEITRQISNFTYNYGTVGQKPDLTFTDTATEFLPSNGAGSNRFGHIILKTGDYSYQVFYSYKIHLETDAAYASDTIYGLMVHKKNTQVAVFDKSCHPQSVLNLIPDLDFEG
jgi:hypothetical protein